MKLAFINTPGELDDPQLEDCEYAQTKDGKGSYKKVDGSWLKHEVSLVKETQQIESAEGVMEDELYVTSSTSSYAKEFPTLDFGFEIGEPRMRGTIRDSDLTLKYIHKASTYELETVIL